MRVTLTDVVCHQPAARDVHRACALAVSSVSPKHLPAANGCVIALMAMKVIAVMLVLGISTAMVSCQPFTVNGTFNER